jgi:hypothetical protein
MVAFTDINVCTKAQENQLNGSSVERAETWELPNNVATPYDFSVRSK